MLQKWRDRSASTSVESRADTEEKRSSQRCACQNPRATQLGLSETRRPGRWPRPRRYSRRAPSLSTWLRVQTADSAHTHVHIFFPHIIISHKCRLMCRLSFPPFRKTRVCPQPFTFKHHHAARRVIIHPHQHLTHTHTQSTAPLQHTTRERMPATASSPLSPLMPFFSDRHARRRRTTPTPTTTPTPCTTTLWACVCDQNVVSGGRVVYLDSKKRSRIVDHVPSVSITHVTSIIHHSGEVEWSRPSSGSG